MWEALKSRHQISSGRIKAAGAIISFIGEEAKSATEIVSKLRFDSEVFSEDLVQQVLELLLDLGLVGIGEGDKYVLRSQRNVFRSGTEIEISRMVLLKTIKKLRRDLLWITAVERRQLRNLSLDEYQCLADLNLLTKTMEPTSQEWWGELGTSRDIADGAELKKLGDTAEQLSVELEKTYLLEVGLGEKTQEVSWVSRDSDLHGYDILSFRENSGELVLHKIEVKKLSRSPDGGRFFYLSRNEYDVGETDPSSYEFHLWDFDGRVAHLFKLGFEQVQNYIPNDTKPNFKWMSAKILIPHQLVAFDRIVTSKEREIAD